MQKKKKHFTQSKWKVAKSFKGEQANIDAFYQYKPSWPCGVIKIEVCIRVVMA